MKNRFAVLMITLMAAAAVATPGTTPRVVWNITGSVPTGLYLIRPPYKLKVATIVVAYPPEPLATWLADGRYLPRGVPLLKPILAFDGQTVCRVGLTILIDGRETGTALERDHSGHPLPAWQGCRMIGEGEISLMNPAEPDSLDSRYFGPIPTSAIVGSAELL